MTIWKKSKYKVQSKYEEKIGKNIFIDRHTHLVYRDPKGKPIGRFIPASVVRK